MSSPVATGAAPADAPPTDERCAPVLSRLRDAATALGYGVSADASGFTASRERSELQVRCSERHAEIALREASGAAVSVAFGRRGEDDFALELVGEYPDIGIISRTAILDIGSTPMTGSLKFAADAGAGPAHVEVDLEGEILTTGGDATAERARRINAAFAPALSASPIWKDAHVLGYAAAGIGDQSMAAHEARLDVVLALAIPSPDSAAKVDADSKDAVQKCGVSFTICLAAAWLPPAGAWACGVALANCFAALPCLPEDCAGDGV